MTLPLDHDVAPAPRREDRRWLVLAVIAVAQLMVVLDATIVNIALPSAQRDLGFSSTERQWVVTAYAVAFGGLLLVGGRLSDLWGRRRTFLIGAIGFGAASACGGAAPAFGVLIGSRAAQGAFGALLAPSALAILSTIFVDARERGRALGIYTSIAGAGGAVGLLLGGVLTEYLSWRWCLYVNVGFAVIAVLGGLLLLSNQERRPDGSLDVPGSVTVVAGLVAVVSAFSHAGVAGWSDPVTLVLLAGGLVLLGLFVIVEQRVRRPLLPLSVVADRVRGAAYLGLAAGGLAVIGMFLLLTYYLQDVLGFSPLLSGLSFLPFVGGVLLTAPLVSNVVLSRWGPRIVVALGLVVMAGGAGWLTRLDPGIAYGVNVAPALVLFGIGVSAVLVPAFALGPAGTEPADAGVASALVNSSNQIGGSLGAALLNTIAANAAASYLVGRVVTPPAVAAATVHGDAVAFTVLACILGMAALVVALLYPRRSRISALTVSPSDARVVGVAPDAVDAPARAWGAIS